MDVLANSSILIKFEETAALNNSCTQIDLNTLIYAEKPIVCRLCLSADSNNSNFITLLDAIGFETKIVDIVAKHLAFVQPIIGDIYSKHICNTCWQIIENFHVYYTRVYEAQSNFHAEEPIQVLPIKVESSEILHVENDTSCTTPTSDNTETNFDVQIPDESVMVLTPTLTNQSDLTEEDGSKCTEKTTTTELSNIGKLTLSMPKTFDKQVLTDDIFKRFKSIRPYLRDDRHRFLCNFCSESFNFHKKINNHITSSHPLPFVCPEGDARFETLQEALGHIKEAHTYQPTHSSTVCSICGKVLATVGSLKSHMESVHRPTDQPKIQCKECGVWLADVKILAIHHTKQHLKKKNPMKCDQCSRILSSEDRLSVHIRRYHENQFPIHKCTICEKEFHFKKRLKEHISSVHSGQALYQCKFCPKTFNVGSNFYTHRRRMHPEEHKKIIDERAAERVITNTEHSKAGVVKHTCQMCNAEFKFKQKLKKHIALDHGGNKTRKCEFCPKQICGSQNYESHKRQKHWAELENPEKNVNDYSSKMKI